MMQPALARRGERLQREALVILETKAARKRKKGAAESVEGEAGPRPAKAKNAGRTWRELVPAVRALGYEDRVRFGQATFDCLPGELLLENARPERLDYPDAEIYLRVISKKERERLKACSKEPFTVDWIHRWVRPGEVLYDVGANVGAYSLIAAKKPGGGARVFAFEPGYANVSSLCANIILNDAAELITPMPFALSNADGLSVLNLRGLEPGSARHTLEDRPSDEGPALYRQPVVTFRLDELIDRFALPLPNHIKLDVDGGELAVLEGAAAALASPALRSILIEISAPLSDDITEALVKRGLALETKVNVRNKAGEYLVWYGLFTREPQAGPAPREVAVQYVSR
jgi:FkbM family methyltransferase